MALTKKEILEQVEKLKIELYKANSKEEIISILKKADAIGPAPKGRTNVFFAGKVNISDDEINLTRVALKYKDKGEIRLIANTAVGKLASFLAYTEKGTEILQTVIGKNSLEINTFIFGSKAQTGVDGIWDTASEMFAKESHGNVLALIGTHTDKYNPNRVVAIPNDGIFYSTEFQAMKKNRVTINGIDINTLSTMNSDKMLDTLTLSTVERVAVFKNNEGSHLIKISDSEIHAFLADPKNKSTLEVVKNHKSALYQERKIANALGISYEIFYGKPDKQNIIHNFYQRTDEASQLVIEDIESYKIKLDIKIKTASSLEKYYGNVSDDEIMKYLSKTDGKNNAVVNKMIEVSKNEIPHDNIWDTIAKDATEVRDKIIDKKNKKQEIAEDKDFRRCSH